jgi:hypothetical protein
LAAKFLPQRAENPKTLTLQTNKSFAPDSKPLQFQTRNAQKREESTHTPNSQIKCAKSPHATAGVKNHHVLERKQAGINTTPVLS